MRPPDHDALYSAFLESLDDFGRFGLTGRGAGASIRPQDPDLMRLVEAIAWFSARTRSAAQGAFYDAVTRMAGGALDGLMVPLPACALVRGSTDDRLVDPVTLPAGTRFQVDLTDDETAPAHSGSEGGRVVTRRCLMTSLEPVTLWPIDIAHAMFRDSGGRRRIDLELEARVPQRGARSLPFHVHRIGSYEASVDLHTALRTHTTAIEAVTDSGEVMPCTWAFDTSDRPGPDDRRDPIVRTRSFFHFPEQALAMTVNVPAPSRAWQRLTLRLVLGRGWSARTAVVDETFQLYMVPLVNAWADFARPIAYDATRDTVSPVSTSALSGVRATAVRGVYRASKNMQPLLPFCVGLRDEGFEVIHPADQASPRVRVRIPTAFEAPEKLMIDTVWSQPDQWLGVPSTVAVQLEGRAVQGADFHLAGHVHLPVAGPLAGDPELTLDLLAVRAQRSLDVRSLRGLMRTMGADGSSPFAELPDRIGRVELLHRPRGGVNGSQSVPTYVVHIIEPPGANPGLLVCFGDQIRAVLRGFGAREVELEVVAVRQAMRPQLEEDAP